MESYYRLISILAGHSDGDQINPFFTEYTQPCSQTKEEQAHKLRLEPISLEIYESLGIYPFVPQKSFHSLIERRRSNLGTFGVQTKRNITQRILPSSRDSVDLFQCPGRAFCGRFSQDGSVFLCASSDARIRLFDSSTWRLMRTCRARDVQWSIIDTDFSPDSRWIIYSSWSNYIHMINRTARGTVEEHHESLQVRGSYSRCCFFSIRFSSDSREIVAGNNEAIISIYNLDKRQTVTQIRGHEDDINTVSFIDPSNQLIASGSDDFLIKIWDRRTSSTTPIGTLVGHLQGITHIDSKGDGRYLISNGKDQCIKLWDLRRMTNKEDPPRGQDNWDYRSGPGFQDELHQNLFSGSRVHKGDQSIMSYRGHQVYQTLIRCYFSPAFTTAQRYIYSGSANGCVYIYDLLTGDIVEILDIHSSIVRDVSWHPQDFGIVSSSWDRTVKLSTPFLHGFLNSYQPPPSNSRPIYDYDSDDDDNDYDDDE